MIENQDKYKGMSDSSIKRVEYLNKAISVLEVLKDDYSNDTITEIEPNKYVIEDYNDEKNETIKMVIDDTLNTFDVFSIKNDKEELLHTNLDIFSYLQICNPKMNNYEVLRALEEKVIIHTKYIRQSLEEKKKLYDYFNNKNISKEVVDRIKPYFDNSADEEKIILQVDSMDIKYEININDNTIKVPEEENAIKSDDTVLKVKKGWNCNYIFEDDSHDKNIYVCENILDTLQIESLGKKAVSIDNIDSLKSFFNFIEICSASKLNYILCLKESRETQKYVEEIINDLKNKKSNYFIKELYIPEQYKSITEWYNEDKEMFDISFNSFSNDNMLLYLKNNFKQDVKEASEYKDISTGFKNWDGIINGIRPSLYVIGAIPSLGKTTLMHQMGDNLAKSGHKVLFFSLEQDKLELTAKSISRLTYTSKELAKTPQNTLQIMQSVGFTRDVRKAIDEYSKFAKNICIIEGQYDTTINSIKKYIEDYIRYTGEHPIIIIDYLQIIRPVDDKSTERQDIDDNVKILYNLSNEYKLPIFVICSVSRAYYDKPIDMMAFKESGGIEYGADILMGLQLQKVHELEGEGNKSELLSIAKSERPRKIELVVLKSKNGMPFNRCFFNYYAEFNYFEEAELVKEESTNNQGERGFDLDNNKKTKNKKNKEETNAN